MTDNPDFDIEATIAEYRDVYEAGNKKRCQELREAWKRWQGEDSLHEMAFGEQ